MKNIRFTIEIDNVNEEELRDINEQLHNDKNVGHAIGECEFASNEFRIFQKNKLIDSYEYHDLFELLIKLSKTYPSVKFKMNLNCSASFTPWIDYYQNGIMESCYAVYPEPKNVSWTHEWTFAEKLALESHSKNRATMTLTKVIASLTTMEPGTTRY